MNNSLGVNKIERLQERHAKANNRLHRKGAVARKECSKRGMWNPLRNEEGQTAYQVPVGDMGDDLRIPERSQHVNFAKEPRASRIDVTPAHLDCNRGASLAVISTKQATHSHSRHLFDARESKRQPRKQHAW